MNAKVTLCDIARTLGLSPSTISRALHGNPRISSGRQKQILKIAKDMGYSPNAMAVALINLRHSAAKHPITAELAWINYWRDPSELRDHKEFDLYWKGAREAAEQLGYRLEEFICHDQITVSRLEKILLARNIQGILIPPHRSIDQPKGWTSFHWEKFSVVRFGYTMPCPKVSVVAADHLMSGILAFDNIRRLGYRRIGYVHNQNTSGRAQAGFLMKQQELPLEERIPVLVLPEQKDQFVEMPRFCAWLKKHLPDVIFTDIAAMRKMLEKAGYQVPLDIGLAATSVLDGGVEAGIAQNSAEIGKAAVETLVSLINSQQTGISACCRQVLIESTWMDGASLPDRNSS